MKEAVTDAQQRPGFPLRSERRSLRSLQDGNENRGQLFALTRRNLGKPGHLLRNLKARPRLRLRYGLRDQYRASC